MKKHLEDKTLEIQFIETNKNWADGFIKILGTNKINDSCEHLRITYVNGGSC